MKTVREKQRDPVEGEIADMLDELGVKYTREKEPDHPHNGLDFYLPDFDLHIECKWRFTERISKQMSRFDNVLVVQSLKTAKALRTMLKASRAELEG